MNTINKAMIMTNRIETDEYGNTYTYDTNGNMTHYKDSDGIEEWFEFDANGKMIDKGIVPIASLM